MGIVDVLESVEGVYVTDRFVFMVLGAAAKELYDVGYDIEVGDRENLEQVFRHSSREPGWIIVAVSSSGNAVACFVPSTRSTVVEDGARVMYEIATETLRCNEVHVFDEEDRKVVEVVMQWLEAKEWSVPRWILLYLASTER